MFGNFDTRYSRANDGSGADDGEFDAWLKRRARRLAVRRGQQVDDVPPSHDERALGQDTRRAPYSAPEQEPYQAPFNDPARPAAPLLPMRSDDESDAGGVFGSQTLADYFGLPREATNRPPAWYERAVSPLFDEGVREPPDRETPGRENSARPPAAGRPWHELKQVPRAPAVPTGQVRPNGVERPAPPAGRLSSAPPSFRAPPISRGLGVSYGDRRSLGQEGPGRSRSTAPPAAAPPAVDLDTPEGIEAFVRADPSRAVKIAEDSSAQNIAALTGTSIGLWSDAVARARLVSAIMSSLPPENPSRMPPRAAAPPAPIRPQTPPVQMPTPRPRSPIWYPARNKPRVSMVPAGSSPGDLPPGCLLYTSPSPRD